VVLTLAVLGPVEVRRDGTLLPLPAGKPTELLIRLALDAGAPVSVDRLIEDLWGAAAMPRQRNTLQSKVSRLRRAFGDGGAVTVGPAGYALDVGRGLIDVFAASRLAEEAAGRLAVGDPEAAVQACGRALAMFRGEVVLPDAGDGDWLVPHRARLNEVRLGLLEDQLEARLQLGGGSGVIGELEAELTLNPLRERLWELLVTALYRAGRQADALAAYQRVRTTLAGQLGLDPGPRLQQLERQILAQDANLDAPDVPSRTYVAAAPAGNVPSMAAELVGREDELRDVSALLAQRRLVEVVGPGGVGKTALAVEVGRRLTRASEAAAGGVWLVRLESASTASQVLDAVIAAMGIPGGESALLDRLRSLECVLVLDNCEHVVAAVSTLAVRLLDAAPGLRVLATSQAPLSVDGESVFELGPLPLPDAVRLFMRRTAAQRPTRSSDRDGTEHRAADPAVLDLCRSLDGLPLAIELAAARTRTLSPQDISRRLDDRLAVLSDPTSSRPERLRSLRSTIRWSYDLLFPDDQRGLWALSTFIGGATLPAVESVLDALEVPPATAMDVVSRLASRSLVIVDHPVGAPEAGDPGRSRAVRYQLLDSIRAFAVEAMTEARMAERALAAHTAWFAAAADRSTEGVRGRDQAEYLAFVRDERPNIDAALAWTAAHDPALGLRIANGFGWAWVVLGDHRAAERLVAALDACDRSRPAPPDQQRAGALLLAAWSEASSGRLDIAREHLGAASALAEATGDVELSARCCYYLAYVASHEGDFGGALGLTDRSRALYATRDRPWDQAANALFAVRAAISAGDRDRSVVEAAQAVDWLRQVEDPWLQVRGEAALGELARLQYRFDDAVAHLRRAAETSARLGFQQTEAYQLSSLGRAQCQAGDYAAGAATLALAVEKAEATGDVRLAALARVHLGRVLRATGQLPTARAALEQAGRWHRRAGGGEQTRLGDCLLAAMDAVDLVPGAEARLVALLESAQHSHDAPSEVFALDGLARLAAEAGNRARAQALCEEADRRMAAAAHFITDRDRLDARAARASTTVS
jgi:predicted ATPase/DNA-binding SARP family transcriptional activator